MKICAKRIFSFAAFLFAVLLLAACPDFVRPGNGEYDGTKGLVKISMGGDPLHNSPRTLLPITSYPGRYSFKFTNLAAGIVVNDELSIPGSSTLLLSLVPGNWVVEVDRYETRPTGTYLVASGTAAIAGLKAGDTTAVPVTMNPIDGDTGFFSYSINLPLAGIKADLSIIKVSNGAHYGFGGQTLPSVGTLSGTISLPPGDYDVHVSLTTPGGLGTGKYCAARIFSGMLTDTDSEFTGFAAGHFVQSLNLAGRVNFDPSCAIKPDTSLTGNLSVQAYDPVTNNPVLTPGGSPAAPCLVKWNGSNPSAEWQILNIAPDKRSVYFVISVEGDDGKTYLTTKPLITVSPAPSANVLSNIPDNGIEGIALATGIYNIDTSGTWPIGLGDISPSGRTTASPGETVTLNISTDYGMKAGTLSVLKGSESIEVNGANKIYSFTMPDGNVNVDAAFYSARLGSLSLSSGLVSIPMNEPFNPITTLNYTASVPNNISSISIQGSAEESEMQVTGTGEKPLTVVGLNPFFMVNVVPPLGSGQTEFSRDYSVRITRRGDDTLSSLSLSSGALYPAFNPLITQYSAVVNVSSITVTPTSSAAVEYVDVTGPWDSLIPNTFNSIYIDVMPQHGTLPEHIKQYTISVYYSP